MIGFKSYDHHNIKRIKILITLKSQINKQTNKYSTEDNHIAEENVVLIQKKKKKKKPILKQN